MPVEKLCMLLFHDNDKKEFVLKSENWAFITYKIFNMGKKSFDFPFIRS